MDSYDQYDILNEALTAFNDYPSNSLRSHSFKHDLVAYNDALGRQESRLFEDDPDFSGVKLLEAYDGCGKLAPESNCSSSFTKDCDQNTDQWRDTGLWMN